MKSKKTIILISAVAILLFIFGVIYFNKPANNAQETANNETASINEQINTSKVDKLALLGALSGVKGNNIEITNMPLGFKGEVFVPAETITNGLNYFLKRTENNKMEDLKIEIDQETMNVNVNYKVMKGIKTPIELRIVPRIDENKNLEIKIDAIKLLDLKLPDWIVNKVVSRFIEDWFPKDSNIKVTFNKDSVVIDKDNLKGIIVEELLIKDSGLQIKGMIDVNKLL
ncbi:MAG: hypothetical protein AB9856_02455 [Cellulosilyticaceae bacterium]